MIIDDLRLLRREDLKDGQCIEIADLSGTSWGDRCLFLRDDLFAALLNPDFEKANSSFSFFGTAEFEPRNVTVLVTLLKANSIKLETIRSYEDFLAYVNRNGVVYDIPGIFQRASSPLLHVWPQVLVKFKTINAQILSYIVEVENHQMSIHVCGL
jgi:hypothetical protein